MTNPKNWKQTTLGEVAELVIDYRGKTPKKLGGDWSESGYRALSAKNVKGGRIVNSESIRFVDGNLYRKWMKEEIQRGDLLLTSEAPLGECLFWNSDEKIVLSQRLFAVRVNSEILDPRFFYIYAGSRIFQGELHGRASGSTVQGIRQSELLKIKMFIPPLDEQHFIADLLFSLDDKIELLRAQNKTLEEMAQRLFKEWFLDFNFPNEDGKPYKKSGGRMVESEMGEIPDGWRVGTISEIATVDWGNTNLTKSSYTNDGKYLGVSAAGADGRMDHAEYEYGAVVISAIGAYCGRLEFPSESFTAIKNTIVVKQKSEQYSFFVYLGLLLDWPLQRRGAAQPFLSKGDTESTRIVIPNETFFKDFEAGVNSLFLKKRDATLQIKTLTKIRDILLPKLMSSNTSLK